MAESDGTIHPSKLAPGLASAGLVPQQVERVSARMRGGWGGGAAFVTPARGAVAGIIAIALSGTTFLHLASPSPYPTTPLKKPSRAGAQMVGDLRLGWEAVSKETLLHRIEGIFTAYPLPHPA